MTIQNNAADRYQPFSLTEVQESFYVGRTAGGHAGGTQIHLEFEADHLDPARLRESWNRCVADTDMLRAHLLPDARQAVLEQAPEYRFEVRDLTAVGRDELRASLERMRRESAAAIDPHRWPLFALAAAELPGGRTRVMLTVEELIADGPSVSLLVQDWYARYAFGEEPGVPEISFRDYALATGGRRPSEESLAYWRDKLGAVDFGRPLPLARPDADPAAAADGEHRRMTLHLDREQWDRAKEAAREARATPSAMLLALNAAAVGTAGSGPLPLVLTTYNRLPLHADVARLVGPFLSTSVFVAPEAAGTLGELLGEVSGQLWRDLEHGDVSGVRALRERARTEPGRRAVPVPVVFTSLLGSVTDRRAADPGNWAALVDVDASATRTSGVQLEMCVQERAGQLHVSWDYLPGALDGAEVRAAFERLGALLRRVAALGPAVWNTGLPATAAPDAGTETAGRASFGTAGRLPLTEVQSAYLVGRLGTLGGATETRVYQEFLLENHDVDTLEAAWNRLVAHHPMLRAAVHQDGTLEVAPAVPHYRITRHDLTGLRPAEGPPPTAGPRSSGRSPTPPPGCAAGPSPWAAGRCTPWRPASSRTAPPSCTSSWTRCSPTRAPSPCSSASCSRCTTATRRCWTSPPTRARTCSASPRTARTVRRRPPGSPGGRSSPPCPQAPRSPTRPRRPPGCTAARTSGPGGASPSGQPRSASRPTWCC